MASRTLKSLDNKVPLTGWMFLGKDKEYEKEQDLKISSELHLPCSEIIIEATGDAAIKHQTSLGTYLPTVMYNAGRRVFKHKTEELYLLVHSDTSAWSVQRNVQSKSSFLHGGRAPSMCPADTRAQVCGKTGVQLWRYSDGGWKHGEIKIKCSTHSHG